MTKRDIAISMLTVLLGAVGGAGVGLAILAALVGRSEETYRNNDALGIAFLMVIFSGPFAMIGSVAGATHAIISAIHRQRHKTEAPPAEGDL
jgi:hypothetical protein